MDEYFKTLLRGTAEKVSDKEFATEFGRKLTPEEGLRLQNELLSNFSSQKFQTAMWAASSRAAGDEKELQNLTAKLCMDAQIKVVAKYGFPATEKGVVLSTMAFGADAHAHPPVAEKRELIQYLLNPDMQKELAANTARPCPRGVCERRRANPDPNEWTEEECGTVWVVVGGKEHGGIVVRREANTSSAQFQHRLGTNAVIEELEVKGERLHYQKMDGDGPDIGWVSTSLKGNPLVVPYLDFEVPTQKDPKDEVKNYVVVHDRIAQRDRPHKDGTMIGGAAKGATFKGHVVSELGIDWLKINEQGKDKFMLIDGASIGMGPLLEEVKVEKAKTEKWKVVHDRIAQRDEPKKDGKMVGAALKGQEFKGTVVKADDDVEWLMIKDKGTAKYMMIDGKTVGLGILLEKA